MNNRYYQTLDSTIRTIFEAMRDSEYQSLSGPVQFMVSEYLDCCDKLSEAYSSSDHALMLYRLRTHLTVYVSEEKCFPKLSDTQHQVMVSDVKHALRLLDNYSWVKATGTIKDFTEWSVYEGERILTQVLLILALRDAFVRRRAALGHDYYVVSEAQSFTTSCLNRLCEVTKGEAYVKMWKSAYNLMWDYIEAARRDFDCPFYQFPTSKSRFISNWMDVSTGNEGEENV